jgi:hypothetical protein
VGLTVGPVEMSFFPPKAPDRILYGMLATVIALAVAGGVAFLVRRVPLSARWIAWAALAMLVANLWGTTLMLNRQPTFNPMIRQVVPPLNDQLKGQVPPGYEDSDHLLYLRYYQSVRAGESYYPSVRKHFIEWSGGRPPNTVLNIRSPLVTYFWAALPGPTWIVIAFLVLATVAVFMVPPFVSGVVKMPLAIPGAAALCAYFLFFPRQLLLLTTELWAVIPAMIALALTAVSLRSARWRELTVLAVALAALALMIRETLVFVPLAGLVGALAVKDEQRRFRVIAWSAGTATAGAFLAVHYWLARSIVERTSQYQGFASGGVSRMLEALTFATDHLGLGGWLAFTLAALGLLGALLLRDLRVRLFALVATVTPLVAFLFVSNAALDTRTGTTFNYWGVAVVPLLYLCIPVAFSLLPGAATKRGVQPAERAGRRR